MPLSARLEAVPLDHDAGVGDRIAYHRRRRGMTQAVLSGLVGRSEEWLSQIERGSRTVERLTIIVDVARALRVEPVALLPPPFHSTARRVGDAGVLGTAPDTVPGIRAALMRPPGRRSTRRPPHPKALENRIAWAFRCSQTERWSDLGPALPDLIEDAHAAADHAPGDPSALTALSLAYRVTSGMLDRIGEPHLPWIAAERAAAAAEQAEDPLLIGGAAWRWAVVLRHAGELEASLAVPAAAAEMLVPRRTGVVDPPALSVHGALLLKAAVAAASLDDRRAVDHYLSRAEDVAATVGEQNHFWFAFGPTNVRIHRVWLATELGDPRSALDLAGQVDADRLPAHLSERRTSHLITVAWSHHLRRQDDEAVRALVAARTQGAEQLLFTRRARDMVATMLKRDRRRRRELRALAEFLDVADR
jgi:transcriptional regulator with XRE-family HTH domain